MTSEQAYLSFLQLVNRNFTNDNIDVDKSRFVMLYNRVQSRYVEWVLEKRNDDELRDIQDLLVLDKSLIKLSKVLNHQDFEIPKDYFNLSTIQVYASKSKCKDVKIGAHEVKNDNVEEYIIDSFNEPSFEYRETFYTLNSNRVSVYFKDFEISKVFLSYYRYPKDIDILGYIDINGANSTNSNPELPDRVVNKVLLAMSKEYSAINEEYNKYQVDKDRLFSKI